MRPGVVEVVDFALLPLQAGEINRSSIYPRRSSSLESAYPQPEVFQLLGQIKS
jgi:hypothetical protein